MFPMLIPLISSGMSLLGGLFGGHKAKQASQHAAGGATLQQLMPQILAMIQQQQQHNAQNYQTQQTQYQANQPLQDAVRRMALNLTPNHLQPQGGGLSSRVG